jgi:hypothetical protein
MKKVVYNTCFGGFSLSAEAIALALQWGLEIDCCGSGEGTTRVARHHPVLVAVVETLGEAANGDTAFLRVRPLLGSKYRIEEYDGREQVVEPRHLRWIEAD